MGCEFRETEQLVFTQVCNATTVRVAFQNVELLVSSMLASSCKHNDHLQLIDIDAAQNATTVRIPKCRATSLINVGFKLQAQR